MITSVSNPRVKNIAALRQKAKERELQDVFLVEGEKMFLEAPMNRILEVYLQEHAALSQRSLDKYRELSETGNVCCEQVSQAVFEKMSDTKTPQGILCVVRQYHYSYEDCMQKENPLLVILEDIQDPGNLGTIMRTAEGAGVDGILMTEGTADIYNPKTIRATMGSIYRVPFVIIQDVKQTISFLKKKQVHVLAAHLKGQNFYNDVNYQKGTAFLIGNEGNGLKEETAALADEYIKIPMQGKLESLNAAVATALLIYEADRQRHRGE